MSMLMRCELLIQQANKLVNDQQNLMEELAAVVNSDGDTLEVADLVIDALDTLWLDCIDGPQIRKAAKYFDHMEGKK